MLAGLFRLFLNPVVGGFDAFVSSLGVEHLVSGVRRWKGLF